MKVFTVGLDQKVPPPADAASIKDAEALPAKPGADMPPPGYVANMPVQIPPPLPPTVVVRKSRGYKGVLLVMLAVFLMAIFALTISEIAYNRHREENYFRLRWAELKHRLLGYNNHRSNERIERLRHHGMGMGGAGSSLYPPYEPYVHHRPWGRVVRPEIEEPLPLIKSKPVAPPTTAPTTTSTEKPAPSGAKSSGGESSESEQPQPQQPIGFFPFGQPMPPFPFAYPHQQQSSSSMMDGSRGGGADSGMLRDARLQFLRAILQKIKQRAEAMGFDGTMQVSVIEMEPQSVVVDDEGRPMLRGGSGGSPGGSSPMLTNHFTSTSTIGRGLPSAGSAGAPNWPQQGHGLIPMLPLALRPMPPPPSSSSSGGGMPPFFGPGPQRPPHQPPTYLDPRSSAFLDGFGEIHQPTPFQQSQLEQQQQQRIQEQRDGSSGQQSQQQQQSVGEEKEGSVGSSSQQSISDFGESPNPFRSTESAFPFFRPQPLNNHNNWPGQMVAPAGQQQQVQLAAQQQAQQPPPHQPPHIQLVRGRPPLAFEPQMQPPPRPETSSSSARLLDGGNEPRTPTVIVDSSSGNSQTAVPSETKPSQEAVGEVFGRKFGRLLQDIFTNRIHGFQQGAQAASQPPKMVIN